jgi:hypothetical protein
LIRPGILSQMWVSIRKQFGAARASLLCRREAPLTSAWETIGWWEARRIPYNFIVGTAGILTCVVLGVIGIAASLLFNSDFGMPDPPLFAVFGVLFYGIAANICFTGGWVVELVVRAFWPKEAGRFASLSLTLGVIFSVLLTLTPAVLALAIGIFKLLARFIGTAH